MKSYLARALAALVTAVTVVVLAPTSPASAVVGSPDWIEVNGDGKTYVPNDPRCLYNDFSYTLAPFGAWGLQHAHDMGSFMDGNEWEVTVTLFAPDGTATGASYTHVVQGFADGFGGPLEGRWSACYGAGTYLLHASGWWCPLNLPPGTAPDCETIEFTTPFTLLPATGVTSVTPVVRTFDMSKNKTLKVSTTLHYEGRKANRPLKEQEIKLQYLKGDRWVKWEKRVTDDEGKAVFQVRFKEPGKYKFRAVNKGANDFTGSTSSVFAVRVVR